MKKIEHAKSWFVLANLFMMLAGFMFAASGLAFMGSMESLNQGTNLLFKTQEICLDNVTKYNCETMLNVTSRVLEVHSINFELWPTFLEMGAVISILSFLAWIMGNYKLWRIKNG